MSDSQGAPHSFTNSITCGGRVPCFIYNMAVAEERAPVTNDAGFGATSLTTLPRTALTLASSSPASSHKTRTMLFIVHPCDLMYDSERLGGNVCWDVRERFVNVGVCSAGGNRGPERSGVPGGRPT